MKAKLVVIANKGSVCSMGIGKKYKAEGGGRGGGGSERGPKTWCACMTEYIMAMKN